jgi:hypothetical protein
MSQTLRRTWLARVRIHACEVTIVALAAACAGDSTAPRRTTPTLTALDAASASWGPESPPFNLEAILRPAAGQDGFGLVKFRQPNDANQIVYLDVWVRDLAPNTSYLLQRASDAVVNDDCTGSNWLTLGQGTTPQAITTDARGTGRAALFRNLAAFPVGAVNDIHFRVIDASTQAVVLTSGCYQFTITQ